MRPSIIRRMRWGAMLALCAVTVTGLVGAACNADAATTSDTTYTEPLVAAPNVTPPVPRGTTTVIVNLEAVEKTAEIAPGVTYDTWTFNGSTPGPLIRATVGQTVEIHLKNLSTNTQTHNIDLHATIGPGGGAGASTVAPGEEKVFTFKATSAGLFVYHCAAGMMADHISNGMYGGILIDPAGGQDTVAHEYYVGQNEYYTTGDTGAKGMQDMDLTKMQAEEPTYVAFNGNTTSLTANPLTAAVGESVRIYFVNGGPNLTSSFHIVGEILDKAWPSGSLENDPQKGMQTMTVAPGNALIAEFKTSVPGDYKLVDHALSRVSQGALGTLRVTGANNPGVFNSVSGVTGQALNAHDMTGMTMTPEASATTAPAATPTAAATTTTAAPAGSVAVEMKDNLFVTTQYTVKAGEKVTFAITNDGKIPHNMSIAPANGNFDDAAAVTSDPQIIGGGKTGTLVWQAPTAPGTYKFRCDLHPDQMTGTITVTP